MTFKKACIISLNGAISASDFSHRAHWPKLRRLQLLEAGWAKEIDLQPTLGEGTYDAVIYYWGIEWSGALNLYGGATAENASRLDNIAYIAKFKNIKTFCLDLEMPDIGELAQFRTAEPGSVWAETDWAAVSKACRKVETLTFQAKAQESVVIGDSHAGSQYRPGWAVMHNDFHTLHGVLKDGLLSTFAALKPKAITWYFGSIDLRHHLARQDDPGRAARELVREYCDQIEAIRLRQGGEMEIVAPLPIEPETRSIPKTGWYKGRPFWGDWATRNALRTEMVREMKAYGGRYGFAIYEWPAWFQDETGAMKEKFMEKPGSVHLAWAYRRHEIQLHNGKEW